MGQYFDYLQQLFYDGELTLEIVDEPTPEEIEIGVVLAQEYERGYRLEMAGTAPEFLGEPFTWAALQFYRAAQFILFRDIPAEVVQSAFSELPPTMARSHATLYSVDLTFRFLPDLLLLAASEAVDDPVTHQIQRWIREWPLSSATAPTEEFSDHPTLRHLYVERLLNKSKRFPEPGEFSDPLIREHLELLRLHGEYS